MTDAFYPHLMLDIEALAIHQTEAVVVSVGLVEFDLDTAGPRFGRTAHLVPEIKTQIIKGRIIDPKTVEWWRSLERSEALKAWLGKESSVDDVLDAVADFSNGKDGIWANGICYDVGNIENLFTSFGHLVPWRYNSPRDARTIYKCFPKQRTMPDILAMKTVGHNALDDCVSQVWRLWEHWPTRGLRMGNQK